MIYLINQRMHDRTMSYMSDAAAIATIADAQANDYLISALDTETAEKFSKEFDIKLNSIETEHFGKKTPDGAAFLIADDIEFGDVVITLELKEGRKQDYYFAFRYEELDYA